MAFDATRGGSEATSYVAVARADDIFADTFKNDDWAALSDDEKQIALMAATANLDVLMYVGEKCSPSSDDDDLPQALQWPRSNASCRGVNAACDMIPLNIERATCYLALDLHNDPNAIGGGTGGGGAISTGPVKRQKLGDLEQEFFEPGTDQVKVDATAPIVLQKFPWLVDLLGCWYDGGGVGGSSRLLLRVRS